jgi:hypothetical protein
MCDEVPKHFKKAKKKKFGIRYRYDYPFCSGVHTLWYATEKARDQAFIDLPRREMIKWTGFRLKNVKVRDYYKVER